MSTNPVFGKFVWYDQMSEDLKGSEAFYKKVVGWDIAANTMNEQAYSILKTGDAMVGGLMPTPEDARKAGMKAGWTGYVAVDDVDAFAQKVKGAGGAVYRPAADIPNVGRFAVVADPDGAGFILFKGNGEAPPPQDPQGPGQFGWRELHAGNGAKAFDFYAGLFGWTKGEAMDMGPGGVYQIFNIQGTMAGGIMNKMAEEPRPHWLYYINVDAADAAVERVKAGGGQVLNGPMEVPGGLWATQALDPQGAMFGLLAPKR
ncbi:MAG: VOC family protein [Methylobacteriaceae bacterium]|nr:VOC family protein [Methylobacteriaceae bacterium]MBV9219660.1 VOC family protein [Methylobacteriaceae bacterium]